MHIQGNQCQDRQQYTGKTVKRLTRERRSELGRNAVNRYASNDEAIPFPYRLTYDG